jgi:hypothetical protein
VSQNTTGQSGDEFPQVGDDASPDQNDLNQLEAAASLDSTTWLTEDQSGSLMDAGIHFAEGEDLGMQAEGTHVSTTLSDLEDLGVHHYSVDAVAAAANPGHDLVLALGDIATGDDPAAELLAFLQTYAGNQFFDPAADVALEMTQTVYAAIESASDTVQVDIITALVDLGVDEVRILGSDPVIEHDLHNQ